VLHIFNSLRTGMSASDVLSNPDNKVLTVTHACQHSAFRRFVYSSLIRDTLNNVPHDGPRGGPRSGASLFLRSTSRSYRRPSFDESAGPSAMSRTYSISEVPSLEAAASGRVSREASQTLLGALHEPHADGDGDAVAPPAAGSPAKPEGPDAEEAAQSAPFTGACRTILMLPRG